MIVSDSRLFHILLVEDDDNHAELAALALEDALPACRLSRAKDGAEAIAYLRRDPPFETAPQPDVILLDLQLPKMGGHEVLRVLRADPILSTIPTIVLTTSEAEADLQKAYAEAANSYLVKPVDFDSFNRMMTDFKNYWSVWNRSTVKHGMRRTGE